MVLLNLGIHSTVSKIILATVAFGTIVAISSYLAYDGFEKTSEENSNGIRDEEDINIQVQEGAITSDKDLDLSSHSSKHRVLGAKPSTACKQTHKNQVCPSHSVKEPSIAKNPSENCRVKPVVNSSSERGHVHSHRLTNRRQNRSRKRTSHIKRVFSVRNWNLGHEPFFTMNTTTTDTDFSDDASSAYVVRKPHRSRVRGPIRRQMLTQYFTAWKDLADVMRMRRREVDEKHACEDIHPNDPVKRSCVTKSSDQTAIDFCSENQQLDSDRVGYINHVMRPAQITVMRANEIEQDQVLQLKKRTTSSTAIASHSKIVCGEPEEQDKCDDVCDLDFTHPLPSSTIPDSNNQHEDENGLPMDEIVMEVTEGILYQSDKALQTGTTKQLLASSITSSEPGVPRERDIDVESTSIVNLVQPSTLTATSPDADNTLPYTVRQVLTPSKPISVNDAMQGLLHETSCTQTAAAAVIAKFIVAHFDRWERFLDKKKRDRRKIWTKDRSTHLRMLRSKMLASLARSMPGIDSLVLTMELWRWMSSVMVQLHPTCQTSIPSLPDEISAMLTQASTCPSLSSIWVTKSSIWVTKSHGQHAQMKKRGDTQQYDEAHLNRSAVAAQLIQVVVRWRYAMLVLVTRHKYFHGLLACPELLALGHHNRAVVIIQATWRYSRSSIQTKRYITMCKIRVLALGGRAKRYRQLGSSTVLHS